MPYAPDGEPSPSDPPLTIDPAFGYEVLFGDGTVSALQRAEVLWAGKAPGMAGVDQINFRIPENAQESCAVPMLVNPANLRFPPRSTQVLSIPVSRSGGACQSPARDGFLRLVLVREFNSGIPGLPPRRDRLWVDFFASPPPAPLWPVTFPGNCNGFASGRLRGRVCPGLEGVSNDFLAEPLVYQSQRWEAKVPQNAGTLTVTSWGRSARLEEGLPNGLPFYPPDLPVNFLRDGPVKVSASGGTHLGPFEAEITLPPFQILNDLSPGTVIGIAGVGLNAFRWTGGTPKGMVRSMLSSLQCGALATRGWISHFGPRGFFGEDVNNQLEPLVLVFNPDESEDVTFTANGLKYGGRLSYLYVYRFGGLKLRERGE